MDENNIQQSNTTYRYPPKSNPPKGLINSNKLKKGFSNEGASMMPKLQDFNQMFRQHANSLLDMNESVFPPGHPLYNRDRSISSLKDANDKLLKENLELRKSLESQTSKNQTNI